MDESQIPGNRRARRSNVLLAAALEVGGASIAVKLRNLSEQGALVEAESLPVEGSEVVFRRNELCVCGRIAWVKGKHAGIAFASELSPQDVLRNIPQPKPRVQPDFRRPGLNPRLLSPTEQAQMERMLSMFNDKKS